MNVGRWCVLCAVFGMVFFAGCGNRRSAGFVAESADDSGVGIATASAKSTAARGEAGRFSQAAPVLGTETDGTHLYERKLIRSGDVSILVDSLSDTRTETDSWVESFGGYVSSSSENSRTLSLVVRIPADRFDEAMGQASGMGKLQSKNVNSDDVSEQFYDLQGRIETKRILLERYQNYLRQATKMSDILDVEARINDVTAELESMMGRMNRLSSQIDYSTIHIRATLPPKQTEQGFVLPDTHSWFLSFVGNSAGFFNGLLFVLLYIVIFGIPLVLIAAGLWWLCFGRLGLVRRLFLALSRRR